ncbi:receptor-type tyrosine-protein phosphatase kappa-like isoform X3 [Centruroides sculpturatus]|nr:receptor-type tyrosine-protein phosphatase kappa-like isoform X3 [Centruroides sculpturatus]
MWTVQSRESGWSFSNNALEEISNEIDEGWEKRVHTSKLEEYVVQRRNDNRLVEEFESIPNELLYACRIATLKENKRKNRYENILPYDHTRVVLDVLPNDSYSDYINANYINGYKIEKKYIATQGPTPLRMVDFWRMVWQVKCSKIVMITNLVENGETKCKKYWPKKADTYGNLKVQLMDQDVYADFTIRTFLISKDNEINQVKQFHFTTWTQKRIPLYTSSVLIFIGKIRDFQPPNQGPIIVHSSAGIGRTGAFILLDYMMDMIQWEEHVNLPKCVREMRHQRMNMVETAEQYIFIYETILDALWPFNTSIPPKDFRKRLCELKSVDPYTGLTYIENEFKRLNRMYPCSTENLFNTFSSFESIKRSNMGSLHVDGYRKKKAFVVSAIPHSNQTKRFWKFVCDTDSLTVVLLNDLDSVLHQGFHRYWPREGTIVDFGQFSLEYMSREINQDLIIRNFKCVCNEDKNKVKIIKHFHLSSWRPDQRIPSSADCLIDLMDKMEKWQQETVKHQVVIQCLDGVRASGIFATCYFISNKIKFEHEVDVYLAAKTVRQASSNFIESLEQYTFCYHFAECFMEKFKDYANFS